MLEARVESHFISVLLIIPGKASVDIRCEGLGEQELHLALASTILETSSKFGRCQVGMCYIDGQPFFPNEGWDAYVLRRCKLA